jgi:hypothetical protein
MSHLIHRIQVELSAPDRGVATMAQNEVSLTIHDDLPAVLTPVLDVRFPTGVQRRIDRLELNLGTLPSGRFREAFLRALISQFEKFSSDAAPAPSRDFPVLGKTSRNPFEEERSDAAAVFLHYVATGFLPWWCSISRWRDQIPSSLIEDSEALATLRHELPILFAQVPERVLRLLPFPALIDKLVAPTISQSALSRESADAINRMPEPLARRARLARWCVSEIAWRPQTSAPIITTVVQRLLNETQAEKKIVRQLFDSMDPAHAEPAVAVEERAVSIAERGVKHRAETRTENVDEAREGLPTESAGLVLLHPFLSRFFESAGWLDEDGRLRNDRKWHAVQSLHFLARGSLPRDEVEVVLEKTLCGIELAEPADWPEMGDELPQQANALLSAVIDHWAALKDTSPTGLREAFLKRPGLLYLGDVVKLQVESRPQDVLLSRIPWSYEYVALPWIGALMHVRWSSPF